MTAWRAVPRGSDWYDCFVTVRRTVGETVRGALRLLGELLVAAGLMLGLFAAWLHWGTSPQPTAEQRAVNEQILRAWQARPTPAASGSGSDAARSAQVPGGALALVRIPALGGDWQYPVYPGVSAGELAKGLGHYPHTAAPGAVGNFAVAGHRSSDTGFEPLADLPDDIRPGDAIVVDTPGQEYVYTVDATERTRPGDVAVLDPDQGRRADPARRLLTVTTCTPRYGSSGRFVVFAHLRSSSARKAGA